jgi:hypothetical protein
MSNNNHPEEEKEEKQDLIYKNNRELFYSFDPENRFSKQVNYQYGANQLIIKQSWDAAEARVNEVKEKILKGELSPIAFFMEKNLMEIPMLSDYSGFPKRKVKKHLKPAGFDNLTTEQLAKYAYAFNISVEELKNPDLKSGIETADLNLNND